jgi:hypothetical protein
MPDITTQIKTAISEEPPLGFGPGDVIATARGVRRRRRGAYAAVTAGVAAAVTAGTVLALPGGGVGGGAGGGTPGGGTADGHAAEMSLTSLSRIAGKQPAAAPSTLPTTQVDGVTAAQVFALFEKDTSMKVTGAQATLGRPPAAELDLAAGLAVTGHPYLNIQVTPADTMITTMPSCAELSDLASGSGDGYYGPCSVQRLPDGSILIVRSGETTQGHFTMAQATLIRPDGSGVFAEDTNQANQSVSDVVKEKEAKAAGKPGLPPVVSAQPPVGANALAAFVRDLAGRS